MDDQLSGNLELNWINKKKSLKFELDEENDVATNPQWVDNDSIEVSEPRILRLKDQFGDKDTENMLIRGDNLLALQSLKEDFKNREEEDKAKLVYIDPPFNTKRAFEDYEDNLETSEWLTMMRDRLSCLKSLMREDGLIFVHLNKKRLFHLKLILDELFGKDNFVQMATVESATTASFRAINECPVNVTEYILIYSKTDKAELNRVFVEGGFSEETYGNYIKNYDEGYENWEIITLNQHINDKFGFDHWTDARDKWGDGWKEIRKIKKRKIALNEPERVVSLNTLQKSSEEIKKIVEKSKENREKVFRIEREDYDDIYIIRGRTIVPFKNKLREIKGEQKPTEILTNIWDDIPYMGIGPEGGVDLQNGKKPEHLLKRVISLATNEDDLVIDSFLGSGTTAAVAHKMNRKWIGIELLPNQLEKAKTRMKGVIDKEDPDETGISKDIDWNGGGGFRYYKLGDSIISNKSEINWDMNNKEVAKAVFLNFGHSFERKVDDGVFLGRNKSKVSLVVVDRNLKIINKNDLDIILDRIEGDISETNDLEIFTNNGISLEPAELPDYLEIKKIPESILKRYNL